MTFRTMLLSAAIVLPLVFDSTPVMAQQQRGHARVAVAVANGNGEERRQDEAPQGLMRRFASGLVSVLPAGIVRRFGNPEPAPAPEPVPAPEPTPEPEPVPEPCVPTWGYGLNGEMGTYDCNNVFTPF